MAINSCTINAFTIDSKFCRDKFAYLVPILHPPKKPGGGGTSQSKEWLKLLPRDHLKPQPTPTELERVVVTATFQTLSGTDAQNVVYSQDLVTVTDLSVNTAAVSVNIDGFKVN